MYGSGEIKYVELSEDLSGEKEGGFFDGVGFVEAFSNSDASVGLVLGSFFGLIITIALYVVRKVLNFSDCMSCIPEGFKAMVPAIMILTFAWTLKAMTDSLGAAEFVATTVEQFAGGLMNFLPAIIFLIGCFLAFATGTRNSKSTNYKNRSA